MSVDESDFCRKRQGSRISEEWRNGRGIWLSYGLEEHVHRRASGMSPSESTVRT